MYWTGKMYCGMLISLKSLYPIINHRLSTENMDYMVDWWLTNLVSAQPQLFGVKTFYERIL